VSHIERRDSERRIAIERRQHSERRSGIRPGGRRSTDPPTGKGWSTGQLAHHIGMSGKFVRGEIEAKEIIASRFGSEWRIAAAEVRRYLLAKGYPLPDTLAT
jgi:hypothetical protein